MRFARRNCIILLLFGVVGVPLFIQIYEPPDGTFLLRELNDTGHTLVFAGLSLLLLALSRLTMASRRLSLPQHYLLALTVTALIVTATEAIQVFSSRDANLLDLIRGLAGAASSLAICWSLDSGVRGAMGNVGTRAIRWTRFLGVALLLAALGPLALWGYAYGCRNAAFPRICSFESYWESKFLVVQDAEVRFVAPPAVWKTAEGDRVASLTFTRAEYPGMSVVEPYPNWEGYRFFCFSCYSARQDTISLVLRIHDVHHKNDFHDRYNKTIRVVPAANQFCLSLEEIRTAPRSREMDMGNIRGITFFAVRPTESFSIHFDDIRLK